LRRYEQDWAIYEIIRTTNKNKRNYGKKVGRSNPVTEPDDEEQEDSDNREDEEGTSSSGKRTKVTQGGTNGKRMRK
jgi:hypothetical protein